MNKTDLINKLKQLEGLTQEERAALIELVNTKKKYGLVWEDKPEEVEEQLRTHLPVLREVVEKRIQALPQPSPEGREQEASQGKNSSVQSLQTSLFETENIDHSISYSSPLGRSGGALGLEGATPNHILIEGDNLHALTALTFTHEGKIDVIYIDPPYNTGNKDFKYNDRFIDKEDGYRHSMWLSFMDKRLRIAKQLLKESGVIFISIDDNEQGQLKLIADEIFTERCHVATLPVVMNLKGNPDNYGFSDTHEYCHVYTKIPENCSFGSFDVDEEAIEREWEEDEYGIFKRADTLKRTGQDASRERRPKGWFPVFIANDRSVYVTDNDEPHCPEDIILWPINDDGIELSWTWGKKKIKEEPYNLLVIEGRNGFNVYKKQRPQLGDLPTKKPKSIFYKPEYSTSTSTTELKKILGSKKFDGPKPVPFIVDLIKIGSHNNCIILDFFAGSGTTLHAVMQLNAEDGGNRQCIMVTNNEIDDKTQKELEAKGILKGTPEYEAYGICQSVTYERNRRVIQGYTNSKGQWVEGLSNNNLRYYKSELVGREPSLKNKRELTRLATELLCIKEDCYTEQKLEGQKHIRYFHENGKRFMMVYEDTAIEEAVELIKQLITTEDIPDNGIKVYVFSPGQYPFTEEFEEVWPWIKLCALPDAIYKAYMNVLPKKVRKPVPVIEEETEEETTEPKLFD